MSSPTPQHRAPDTFPRRVRATYAGLAAFTALAWAWALIAFHDSPAALGTAALAYTLGLRHAFDADHIAAIDNVTRRLMQTGQRPAGVGLCFALGHSTIVILACAAVAAFADAARIPMDWMATIGSLLGTLVSAGFLLIVAAMNLAVLRTIWRDGHVPAPQPNGLLPRLLRPALAFVTRSRHMYPLGVLFGLGFDTATEIALLAIAATSAAHGMGPASLLAFPALFTAGMTLMDTTDSVLMVRAYGWALDQPRRKRRYNLAMTSLSIALALTVSATELLAQANDAWPNLATRTAATLTDHFELIGACAVALFLASWALARVRGAGKEERSFL